MAVAVTVEMAVKVAVAGADVEAKAANIAIWNA